MIVFDSEGLEYNGDTKYFQTSASNTAHADKGCPHIQGKSVTKVEEHQLDDDVDKCSDCTCTPSDEEDGQVDDQEGSTDWDNVFNN